MMLFSAAKRGGSGVGSADWRAGGHLRSMRLDTNVLSQFDVWAHQLPKGVWICRCTARNAADARVCWRCRSTRTRSGVRPPGDADPRVEGLTIVTADSFRELVLDSQKHVLLVASASWCPPCQQLKPLVHRLAQLLSHEPMIAIGVIDTDENELQSRYFPEPHIPNVKFFLQGKKRQPISVQGASGMSLDELAGFIEQHTGISIQSAIEKSFPAYAERVGVYELLKKLRACAMTKQVQRSPGQAPLKSLASFLYNELITGCQAATSAPRRLPPPGPPALQRAISAKAAPTAAGAPPALMRAVSGGGSGARTRAQIGYSPTLAMGVSDPRLTERLLDELEKKLLSTARVAQPEDFKSFLTSFLLRASCPSYNHANFYNAMSRVSWQVAPQAVKLLAATRIFRFVLRWAQHCAAAPALVGTWAPPPPAAEMSAAAQRHSWRRIEIALSNEEYRHGLAELGLLLDRGLPPDTAPFGLTPLRLSGLERLLAAAIGHLPAAQFLYVRGASPHVPGGQPPILPVEAAARHNHLRIVELLIENGSCSSRALHFAAAGGSTDVANYLLSKSCSPDATVQGLSPVAVALISRQHSMDPYRRKDTDGAALGAPLSDEGCSHCGLAPGSTVAHLAAAVGGLCEAFFQGLLKTLPPSTVMAPNHRGQTALDLMPTTLRIAIKPQIYSALAAAAAEQSSHHEAVALALERKADPLVSDSRGFSLLNLAAYSGEEALVDVMLSADAKQVQITSHLSALMWAHWCGNTNIVLKLTSKGASLSNADLEGLQRLRQAAAELEAGKEKAEVSSSASPPPVSAARSAGVKLLWPELAKIWLHCWPPQIPSNLSPSTNTYLYSARPLMARMTWGAGMDHGTAMPSTGQVAVEEEEKKPAGKLAEELLQAIRLAGANEHALASAQLLALRLTAEGKAGLSPGNIVALNLFLSDVSFHSECSTALSAQLSQSPAPAVRERAADLMSAHSELTNALQALPARKVVCFRALRLTLAGGLRDFLRGHRLGMDCYRPGSIVMWRHPTSCTQDPALAEELALHGEPAGACGIVFKIRRTASARPVAEFSTTPEHQEVLFPAGSIFRVLGFYTCTSQCLRKGTGSASNAWSAELGSAVAASGGDALTWEEVCRSRSAMVLLDEEDPTVAAQLVPLRLRARQEPNSVQSPEVLDALPIWRRHALQLFKTDMCQFFLEGRCENGDLCSYAHKETEVRNKPDLTKTSMCRKLLRDGACNDERCRFAHSEAELRSTSGFFKMKMCVFAQSGKCKNGNRCRFAHTTDELLPPKPPKVEEEASIQDKKIDAQALSSLGQRHKTAPSQQESHGTGGSTATGNGESTSGNGGSTSGHASGQSSNENSGSGEAQQAHQQAQRQSRRATNLPQKWTTEQMERTENSNENSDGSSWASGNSSVTVVPRSEHTTTGSPQPTSDSSSSGAANTESAANASTGATESLSKGRRGQRTSSGGDLEQATTLLISNMPIYLTQGALLSMFEDLTTTMRGKFDFFYCPWDHKAGHNFGYAIINFTDVAHANEFQQQWTNKDLFRSGRGSKTMKVSKATLQGFDANVDYFRKAEIGGRCRDLRFRPLYRDGEGKLQHLELALPGGVQPRKPGAAEVNHHLRKVTRAADIPKEPDTGQGGESKKAAVLGTSRPEERSRSQVEECRGRPRKRRPDMAEASAAAEAPPPSTPLPEQQEVMPGVQPHDIWQKMSLQQQQQELGPHSRRLY
ncbi:Putative protein disulfide-isomerase C1F5.02 [Durusdinium trenchii]|uniref:NAD(+)--protein-arginine ADP-ribosyltransferase n=1 Tax=Durusdinium trenchii TaxID=1381693 RepID=A0ABP0IPC0_9DINO